MEVKAQGRKRENLEICEVNKCKDENGNWTKWVIERLDNEQKEAYEKIKLLLQSDP